MRHQEPLLPHIGAASGRGWSDARIEAVGPA